MIVDVEITILCEAVRPGCSFMARLYHRPTEAHYSGTGDTALEAVAWALDDLVRRALLGQPHTMARNADARPGEGLDNSRGRTGNMETPRPSASARSLAIVPSREGQADGIAGSTPADHTNEAGCFEQQIPTSPAPRFFSLAAPIATPTPTTPRRARTGRR